MGEQPNIFAILCGLQHRVARASFLEDFASHLVLWKLAHIFATLALTLNVGPRNPRLQRQ